MSGLEYKISEGVSLSAGSWTTFSAKCTVGKKVLGGGVSTYGNLGSARVSISAPLDNGAGWFVSVHNDGISSITEFAWAICATA